MQSKIEDAADADDDFLDGSLSVTGEESAKSQRVLTSDYNIPNSFFGTTALRQLELLAKMKGSKNPENDENKTEGIHVEFDMQVHKRLIILGSTDQNPRIRHMY